MPESTVRASLDMGKESRVVCPQAGAEQLCNLLVLVHLFTGC